MRSSAPRVPQAHLVAGETGAHLLVVDGSRLYGVGEGVARRFRAAMTAGDEEAVDGLLERYGLAAPAFVTDETLTEPPIRALSLAVAQKCNLGCTYCYAQGGEFGGAAKSMSARVAHRAVERLLEEARPGERVNLAFLGGEPLVNRPVLRSTTELAARLGRERDVGVGFSITTNGTLLSPGDGDFFERHGFAVTVSIDGIGAAHDRLRPFRGGRDSYRRILARVRPLLARQERMQVSARVTVTPANLALRETLEGLLAAGFYSVGFSPMLAAPSGRGEMGGDTLAEMLEAMIDCARVAEERLARGERYPFANLMNALREIHRGTCRPYPCGAGAGYLGVSADGELFACHRFVGDDAGAMGDLDAGVDRVAQATWLEGRHVHFQEPCRRCWARYLCGGGCHHEVIHRGRPACDYIRGWLHHCLGAYLRLRDVRPALFARAA